MAIPPLLIIYYQIKSFDNKFIFTKDYFQFNLLPIKDSIFQGLKGFLMIIPFVLLVSLIIGLFIGLLFAVLRLNRNIFINKFAYGYSYLFRGTPLLVQIFIIYFGLGQIN